MCIFSETASTQKKKGGGGAGRRWEYFNTCFTNNNMTAAGHSTYSSYLAVYISYPVVYVDCQRHNTSTLMYF